MKEKTSNFHGFASHSTTYVQVAGGGGLEESDNGAHRQGQRLRCYKKTRAGGGDKGSRGCVECVRIC